MGLKYIAYHNEYCEPFAIVMMDNLSHAYVHKTLKRLLPKVFTTTIGAGFTYYDSKKKTFVTGGDCGALNLISNENDKKLVNTAMLVKAPADAYVIEDKDNQNFSFIFTAKDLIADAVQDLSVGKVFGRGSIAHHIHNTNHPFKLKLAVVKGFTPSDDYLRYVETCMT